MNIDVSHLGTILSVWAHPDDETYLAAGLMSAAADAGQRVVCVSATAGERGTDDPVAWPAPRLGRLRRWESAAALAVLGVADHRILDLPDGGLAGVDQRTGSSIVGALLDEVQPDTIVTGPDGITFHPDHVAVSRWATEAWERRGRRGRLLYAARTEQHIARFDQLYEREGFYMTEQRPIGVAGDDVAVGLTLDGELLDRKLAALAAMASQTSALISRVGWRAYAAFNADETFADAARSDTRAMLGSTEEGRPVDHRTRGAVRRVHRAAPRRRGGRPSAAAGRRD